MIWQMLTYSVWKSHAIEINSIFSHWNCNSYTFFLCWPLFYFHFCLICGLLTSPPSSYYSSPSSYYYYSSSSSFFVRLVSSTRIRVGHISNEWFICIGCIGCCPFIEKGQHGTSIGRTDNTRCNTIDERQIANSVQYCRRGQCAWFERCSQFGIAITPRIRHHIHETPLLATNTIRKMRFPWCRYICK